MKYRFFTIALFVMAALSGAGQVNSHSENATDSIPEAEEETLVYDDIPTSEWSEGVCSRLDQLMRDPLLRTTQLGLMVYDLTDDAVLYRYNERHRMRPASVMKIVTAVTALDVLGGDFKVRTAVYHTGRVEDGTLRGNLYFAGGFDPTFSGADLASFANEVKNYGITRIEGRIVADRSMKDTLRLGKGWCWDDDNPTLSPLLVDRKDNFVRRMAQELRKRGVDLNACELAEGRVPQGVTQICEHLTPIDDILTRMMKNSDNLYAESLFYQIAAATGQRPIGEKQAVAGVKRLIDRLGLHSANYAIADGSGLSLYDYVTPELIVRLLRHAISNEEIYSHLYPALPIAGKDGTLKSRMLKTRAANNVHAKTGSVTSVSSLAGYCTARNGHKLCFAIINQGVVRVSDGRTFQDKVCEALCR